MTQRTTVIGANMRVDGSVAGDGNVIVRGHLEGAVHIGGTLTVAPGAIVRADVVAGMVLVEGCLEGKVRSAGPVRVTSRGVLSGDVQGDIEIEPGGVHRGALRRRGPGSSTDFSSQMPGGRAEPSEYITDPLAASAPPPPGASKASLRLSGPAPASEPEPETVRWYGEAGLSRMNEPPRRESGPIPFAITTGEPRSLASETGLPTVPGIPRAPAAPWSDTSHETPTTPRREEPSADFGRPLKLSASDIVGDDSPPPRLGMDTPQLGMETPDSPLPMPGVGDADGDPTNLPRGEAELTIPNPPIRRTTSPGVSPIRRTFGQNTARHRLDGGQDDA